MIDANLEARAKADIVFHDALNNGARARERAIDAARRQFRVEVGDAVQRRDAAICAAWRRFEQVVFEAASDRTAERKGGEES